MANTLSQYASLILAAKAARNDAKRRIKRYKDEIEREQINALDYEDLVKLIECMISMQYENVVGLLQATVTTGLQDIFNEYYEFKLDVVHTAKTMKVKCLLKTDECKEYVEINYTQGTSVRQVIACLMRITVCYLLDLKLRVVLMDEPFSGMRVERQEASHDLIMDVAERFAFQAIIITQNPEARANQVHDLSKREKAIKC